MSLVAPNEGLADQLDYLLSAPIVGVPPWYLILWSNPDLVPDQATVYADLVESVWYGYARYTLTRDGWTAAVIDGDVAVSTYGTSPLQWTPMGTGEPVYGYAIVTPVDPVIRIIEPFPSPVTVVPGVQIGVLPRVTLTTYGIGGEGRRQQLRCWRDKVRLRRCADE